MLNSYHAITIVKMLMESLAFSRYTYTLPVWGPAISRDFYLAWIVYKIGLWVYFVVYGSMTVPHSAGLALGGFLCLKFIQYRSVLAILGQPYLGEGIAFSPPILSLYMLSVLQTPPVSQCLRGVHTRTHGHKPTYTHTHTHTHARIHTHTHMHTLAH